MQSVLFVHNGAPGRFGFLVEDECEIPNAHEHAVEKHFPLGQEIAPFSAGLATLGAIVSLLGGHTQNDALYYADEGC